MPGRSGATRVIGRMGEPSRGMERDIVGACAQTRKKVVPVGMGRGGGDKCLGPAAAGYGEQIHLDIGHAWFIRILAPISVGILPDKVTDLTAAGWDVTTIDG